MLPLVHVGRKSLADYATLVSRGLMQELRRLAEPLQGRRVVHVSATAFGGGVAEINYTLVPLMADVGLDVEWRIIHGDGRVLQRDEGDSQRAAGRRTVADGRGARGVRPVQRGKRRGVRRRRLRRRDRPRPTADRARSSTFRHGARNGCGAAISTSPRRIPTSSTCCCRRCAATTPRSSTCANTLPPPRASPTCTSGRRRSIRLLRRTWRLSPEDASYIVDQFGVDLERPLLTQVSRFDPWKDPLGVIDAYRLVKRDVPGDPARAGRIDGARRPGRLGLLQAHRRARGRRSGHAHPQQHEQRRRARGQRVPGALARRRCRSRSGRASA